MFRWSGLLGIAMIILGEISMIFNIGIPVSTFQLVWFGYILLIDALVYKLRKHSLLHNDKLQFLFIMILSAGMWWVFELINLYLGNWSYVLGGKSLNIFEPANAIRVTIAFSTILPAFFETYELFKSLHLFSHAHLKKKHKISKRFLFALISFGVFSVLAPIIWPDIFFPLIWFAFFFLLDPINYLHGVPSILQHLEDKKMQTPVLLMLSTITLGFLWEFWNYWSNFKWVYHVPHVGFVKVFEMPVIGYLGYLPFGLSLYSMYYFVYSLFGHKGHLLEHKF
ncbi:MAG: hypothetical protein HY438_01200 [DPANN group archaeon]|nr:hypothetical protein [DPANN group archaeon]